MRIDNPDYGLMKALNSAKMSFIITDPTLTDDPICYVSEGFIKLTGFPRDEIVGHNCRFLQGPLTDQTMVDRLRRAIAAGQDETVMIQNYRADGTLFWNQLYMAFLRDGRGKVIRRLGVQTLVTKEYAEAWIEKVVMEKEGTHSKVK